MTKAFTFAIKVVEFLRSPQGKRDIMLVSAGLGGAVDLLHRTGLV